MDRRELTFNPRGNTKQFEAVEYWYDNVSEEIVYGGSKYSGKSFLMCSLICANALMYDDTMYFIARRTLSDLVKFTMASIREVLDGWGIPDSYYHFNGAYNYYEFGNKSRIYFIECKPKPRDPKYNYLGSIQMTQGAIEEAGEVEEDAAKALGATVGRWNNAKYGIKGKVILTCNPTIGFLYREYYLPFRDGNLAELYPHRKFIQALPTDNKAGDAEYVEKLRRTLTSDQKKRLLEGNWEYDDDPTAMVHYDAILNLFKPPKIIVPGERCMTADIARLGGAKIVSIKWDGYNGYVDSWDKVELPVTLDRLVRQQREHQIPRSKVLVDGDGMGVSMVDFGGFPGFKNNGRALPPPPKERSQLRDKQGKVIVENFDNLKSQCAFRIADVINEGRMHLTCKNKADEKLIIEELQQLKQKEIGTDMKKGIVPKDKVSKELRRSPDFSDTIIMRKYFDLISGRMKPNYRTGNDVKPEGITRDMRRWDNQ